MANRHRGEIDAVLDGKAYTLCLTLGALAELEQAFGAGDLGALAERLGQGRMSARDAIRILTAGLRAAGHDVDEQSVSRMRAEGAASGFVTIVARLLAATFADADDVLSGLR
ncbi:MAG: gene transfer agent family protein [Hyphomicrobiaceae bacterium]